MASAASSALTATSENGILSIGRYLVNQDATGVVRTRNTKIVMTTTFLMSSLHPLAHPDIGGA